MHVPSRLNEYPVGSTMLTVERDAPADSSLASRRGSTVSDEDVPTMMRISSLIIRISLKMLNPEYAETPPRMTTTKIRHVPQKVTISAARLPRLSPPSAPTV